MDSFLPLPDVGRVFTGERRVRLGDAAPSRRLRLDALARYLQDVAEDDAADAGLPAGTGWVLRRTTLVVHSFPELGEPLRLATFCSATAPRWAERTTTVTGAGGGSAQATSVWVAIDAASGAPARLGQRFFDVYGPSANGRRASSRLHLPGPPDRSRPGRPWTLRATDYDVWGHANNAISWAAVEDALCDGGWNGCGPLEAELEHAGAIEPTARPRLVARPAHARLDAWLLDGARVLTAARVRATFEEAAGS